VAGTLPGGFSGDGGLATSARFTNVAGIAADFAGNIFVADAFTFRVRKVDNSGVINTVAGIGQLFFAGDGGSAKGALLRRPQGVAVDETGTVYIADTDNNRIRKVTPQGVIDTIAGDGTLGNRGDAGPARLARFAIPSGVVVDRDGSLLIFDSCNFRLRRMGLDEIITNFANVSSGLSTDTCTFDGGPTGQIAVDNAGNVYVAEDFRNWVRVFLAGGGSRIVAGTGNRGFSGDGGAANLALLDSPRSVAVDVSGNVFIADSRNARIRMVTPGGTITTFAGNGVPGFSGDGGPASAAQLNDPSALAFDRGGNLLIAGGNRVRRVTPAGIITTVAGNGQSGFAGDGGLAIDATFGFIASIATDSSGNVLIADTDNNRIRKVTLSFDPPTLGSVTPSRLSRGATLDVTFTGTNLVFPLAIDAGNDIVVSNVRVFGASVVVTLAISPDAALGPRSISVTTSFGTGNSSPVTILPTMPDLSITSSRNGYFAAGFSGTILVEVRNVGGAAATGPVTVDGTLPTGLRYLSGTGTGWVCEPAGETIRCANAGPLPAGISTTLTLSVAAPAPGLPSFVHSVTVSSAEDVVDDNNAFSENPMIAQPPAVSIALLGMVAGRQGGVRVSLAAPFPHDVTGSVSVAFTPNAVILSDDPAIQFETGGRQIAFTVSANTLVARFSSPRPDEIGIQTGTVAGTLTFNGELNAGLVQKTFSSTAVIPNQPPVLQSIRSNASALSMTLSSTAREVSELILEFKTTPRLQLACGSVPGCSVSGSTLRFDVQSLFENWYRSDSTYGSLTTLTLPWAIQGSVRGAVSVKLRNSQGQASVREAPIP
jgi:uncharacterized repeat protein (TIGR01451 family)